MATPIQKKTELAEVLLALRQRLVDQNVFPTDAILISMRMNLPFPLRESLYAIVLPLAQPDDEGTASGAGRFGTVVHGRFNVYVRGQSLADEAYVDLVALTDQNIGILRKLHAARNALQGVFLTDADGNHVTTQPIQAKFTNEPRKNYTSPEWGECMVELEISYMLNLDITTDV